MEIITTRVLALIRKTASIVLLLCFVLPLSQCTEKTESQGSTSVRESYLYGYDMASQGWAAIKAKELDGAGVLAAVFIVFFVPVVCLGLDERLQAVIVLLSALVSLYILYCWVFLFSTSPQIGGVAAVICWVLLFCVSYMTMVVSWRRDRLSKHGSTDP